MSVKRSRAREKRQKHTFVSVFLYLVLIHGLSLTELTRRSVFQTVGVNALRMPDKVLEKLVGVLLFDDQACGLDDISDILNKLLAVWRELGDVHGGVVEDIRKSVMNLGVGWESAFSEGLDDTVEFELSRYKMEQKMKCSRGEPTFRSTSAAWRFLSTGSTTAFFDGEALTSFVAGARDIVRVWIEGRKDNEMVG